MLDFSIIKLKQEDWKEYKELRLRALKSEPQAFLVSYNEELSSPDEKWRQRLQEAEKGKSWVLFAKDTGGRLMGMIGGYRSEDNIKNHSAEIWGAYIDKENRGKGIGRFLMSELIKEFEQNPDIRTIILEVNKEQVPAIKLYESFGFKEIGINPIKMGDGKEYQISKMNKSIK